MPFFNLRRSGQASTGNAGSAPVESADTLRTRAKHRLIGSVVLVLAAVVGFPLLFDTQPRPIANDIPIEIPNKNAVKPLLVPERTAPSVAAPAVLAAPAAPVVAAKPAPVPSRVAASSSLAASEELVEEKRPAAQVKPAAAAIKKEAVAAKPEPKAVEKVAEKPSEKPSEKAAEKPPAKPVAKPTPNPVASSDDGARAKALLEGQTTVAAASPAAAGNPKADAAPAEGRFVVQIGAFADADKAKESRQKVERAGLRTYTQVAETKDGARTRVRVGPFSSRAEAEKAASKIKSLDLPASILTL